MPSMLMIRKAQMQELEKAVQTSFEVRMLSHVKDCFPDQFSAVGIEGCKDLIALAVEKGRLSGFTTCQDLCRFLNFIFVLGLDFDRDPRLPWAAGVLRSSLSSARKLTRLEELGKEFELRVQARVERLTVLHRLQMVQSDRA